MGFWSELRRGAANAKRAVCRGIGSAIEKIGDVTGNWAIEDFGLGLQCKNPYLEKQIDLNSTDTSVEDTINVHAICEETRNDAARQAKKYETAMFDKLQEKIDKFIDELAEIVPEDILYELDYGIGDVFENDIHNTVSEYVSKFISQDSEEFVKILNMDDSVRAEETEQYVKKVLQAAVEKVQEKCRRKELSIYKRMLEDLENYFTYERNCTEETKKNMEKLQEHKEDMDYHKEQAIQIVEDIAYMECIRTLTYADCKS